MLYNSGSQINVEYHNMVRQGVSRLRS